MERMGVISKINTSTDWCAGMVVVPKQSGDVRICVDLKSLNKNVLREPHPMPKVDDTLALLAGATIFSKLDANSGFWQIPIAPESQPLTTFITPLGGTNSTSFLLEYAVPQHRMNRILESIDRVVCLVDDTLIFGATQEEHEARLLAVLQRLEKAEATLNLSKCEFHKPTIKFLGHVVSKDGICADPEKTSAISNIKPP